MYKSEHSLNHSIVLLIKMQDYYTVDSQKMMQEKRVYEMTNRVVLYIGNATVRTQLLKRLSTLLREIAQNNYVRNFRFLVP